MLRFRFNLTYQSQGFGTLGCRFYEGKIISSAVAFIHSDLFPFLLLLYLLCYYSAFFLILGKQASSHSDDELMSDGARPI